AVSVHTFGKSGMGDIAKIVYVADKIEPGRSYITLSYMESLANLSLNNLVKTVLSNTILYLQKKGLEVAPDALDLLSYLEKNNVDEE
ncbi:MAG: HD domain-containing protein, partial [Treponema sp.]|nr:HD domain-containing protein [Treponema sp.]